MKLSTSLRFPILLSAALFFVVNAGAQADASINILTQNSGQVGVGGTVFVQVDVGNTGPVSPIGTNKVRARISVPLDIVSVAPTPQQTGLPSGWSVVSNGGDVITVCNGSDIIGVNEVRTVLIALQGTTIGGPSTVTGVLLFSNGTNCNVTGTLAGDQTANNTSTSTIEVLATLPVTLTDFDAELVNCEPVLRWTTETEINSDRFELERTTPNSADWKLIGTVAAQGNSTTKIDYHFADHLNTASDKVVYRLKMIDKDGQYKYSREIRVSLNCRTTLVSVYPNPVQTGRLFVSITGASGYTEASLLSLSGQVILRNKMHNGTNSIDVSRFINGVYILNVKDAKGIDERVKVRIQN